MRKLLAITSGRHPFQVGVLAGVLIAAVGVLAADRPPESLQRTMNRPLIAAWLVLLIGGSIAAQLGAFWPGEIDTGLIIEGAGVLAVSTMTTIYVVALIHVQGGNAVAAGAFIGGIALAAWWRTVQIIIDVRKVWHAQREGVTAEVRLLMERYAPGSHPPDPPAEAER